MTPVILFAVGFAGACLLALYLASELDSVQRRLRRAASSARVLEGKLSLLQLALGAPQHPVAYAVDQDTWVITLPDGKLCMVPRD